jgi:hypothetical protein
VVGFIFLISRCEQLSHTLFSARSLLKSMSVKQGLKYDDPASAKEILPFVAFHRLNVEEMLHSPASYSTLSVSMKSPDSL